MIKNNLKIVVISDTHNKHNQIIIPECDILIHAGDWTGQGKFNEVNNFGKWLNKQPANYKIIVPGNHEVVFEKELPISKSWLQEACPDVNLLINESITIEGIKFYGSPITPFFFNWAWNRHPEEIKSYWNQIPDDTEFLITHGPPYGVLDYVKHLSKLDQPFIEHLGCPKLRQKIDSLTNLKYHVFGHIHTSHGTKEINGKIFHNAAMLNEQYDVVYNPIVFEIKSET